MSMTAVRPMPAMASVGEDDSIRKVLAAIKRAPVGPPLTDAERARVAEADRTPGAWLTTEELMKNLADLADTRNGSNDE